MVLYSDTCSQSVVPQALGIRISDQSHWAQWAGSVGWREPRGLEERPSCSSYREQRAEPQGLWTNPGASWDKDFYHSLRRGIIGCCLRKGARERGRSAFSLFPAPTEVLPPGLSFPLHRTPASSSRSPSSGELLAAALFLPPAYSQDYDEFFGVYGENLHEY